MLNADADGAAAPRKNIIESIANNRKLFVDFIRFVSISECKIQAKKNETKKYTKREQIYAFYSHSEQCAHTAHTRIRSIFLQFEYTYHFRFFIVVGWFSFVRMTTLRLFCIFDILLFAFSPLPSMSCFRFAPDLYSDRKTFASFH